MTFRSLSMKISPVIFRQQGRCEWNPQGPRTSIHQLIRPYDPPSSKYEARIVVSPPSVLNTAWKNTYWIENIPVLCKWALGTCLEICPVSSLGFQSLDSGTYTEAQSEPNKKLYSLFHELKDALTATKGLSNVPVDEWNRRDVWSDRSVDQVPTSNLNPRRLLLLLSEGWQYFSVVDSGDLFIETESVLLAIC